MSLTSTKGSDDDSTSFSYSDPVQFYDVSGAKNDPKSTKRMYL